MVTQAEEVSAFSKIGRYKKGSEGKCENTRYNGTGMAPYPQNRPPLVSYTRHSLQNKLQPCTTAQLYVPTRLQFTIFQNGKPEPRTNTAANIFCEPVSLLHRCIHRRSCVCHVPQPPLHLNYCSHAAITCNEMFFSACESIKLS